MMADAAIDTLAAQGEFLRAYWAEIDQDPEVIRRRAEFEKAEEEGKVPDGAVYPSVTYLALRDLRPIPGQRA